MIKQPATEKFISLSMIKKTIRKNNTGIKAIFFLFGGNFLKTAPRIVDPTIEAPSKVIGIQRLQSTKPILQKQAGSQRRIPYITDFKREKEMVKRVTLGDVLKTSMTEGSQLMEQEQNFGGADSILRSFIDSSEMSMILSYDFTPDESNGYFFSEIEFQGIQLQGQGSVGIQSILRPIQIALRVIQAAIMYILISQLQPLFKTINWHTTKPIMFPKLGHVAQNPNKVVSLSGEQTECTNGNKFGQVKDCKQPLNPISINKVVKALAPLNESIEIGTRQYQSAQKSKANQSALIGLDKGHTAMIKFPSPIKRSMTESTMPMSCYSILISSGRYDLLKEYVVRSAWTLVQAKNEQIKTSTLRCNGT